MTDLLPLSLRNVLESGNGVLFIGAGIGFCSKNDKSERMPTGGELATELAKHFGIEAEGSTDLAQIARSWSFGRDVPNCMAT